MRVAITGAGVVTPIGVGLDAFVTSLRSGSQHLTQLEGVPVPRGKAAVGAVDGLQFDGENRAFLMARHSIDLLAILQSKTKGNLTLEEQRLLENSLTELRFRYVQALEESKKS